MALLDVLCSHSWAASVWRGSSRLAASWHAGTLRVEGGHVACGEGEVLQRLPSPVKPLLAAAYRQHSEDWEPLSGPALLQLLSSTRPRSGWCGPAQCSLWLGGLGPANVITALYRWQRHFAKLYTAWRQKALPFHC